MKDRHFHFLEKLHSNDNHLDFLEDRAMGCGELDGGMDFAEDRPLTFHYSLIVVVVKMEVCVSYSSFYDLNFSFSFSYSLAQNYP